ncbi:MAG: FAD-dependent oxidoreductase [Pseudomonadota bacterium]
MVRVLIIGGGAIGLSVAYHLAKRGAADVTLLERNQLTSGTSWHAAGIVGPLRATPNMTRLASAALDVFPALEAETGMSTGYRQTEGYWLARDAARLDELHRIADLGRVQGLIPHVIAASDVPLPMLDLTKHVGALHVPEDGNVNPVDLCMAYARAAKAHGVDIREGVQIERILTRGPRVTGVMLGNGAELHGDRVVMATGAWSRELAATAGIALPLQAVEHMYVVTEPVADLPDPFPVVRDLDRGIYLKGDAGKLVIGGFEPHAKCWDAYGPEGNRAFLELAEDWEQFSPFLEAALELCPALETVGIQHFMNGPESFTADTKPLVGETAVDGLFVAAGMNSVGVMSSAGIGRALADWVVDGDPPMDMWEVDVARADPKAAEPRHMASRMEEAVADLFTLHWPYKQPKAGRGLRKSTLHDRWADAGAQFGVTAGWERPLWYGDAHPYSVGSQGWWANTEAEATEMAERAVLLDLAPMTKLRLTGDDVYEALNWLSCRRLGPDETVRYAPLLNPRGGIEIDATVQCHAPKSARITGPAATRWRDLAWLRRNLSGFDVTISDQTEDFAILGLMGRGARAMMEQLVGEDLEDFKLGQLRRLTMAGSDQWVQRLSFVGEHGYELWLDTKTAPSPDKKPNAEAIFDALTQLGARPMGHFALDGCRIEKGFKHWGHDIGPAITPIEAGLSFTVDFSKDFQGKAALLHQRENGVHQRVILLEVPGDVLLLHDEPVYEAGRHVGYTTSGARGPRTKLNLCFALISTRPGETLSETGARDFTVRVAGQLHKAIPQRRAPFDPTNERMRL